MTIAVTGLSHHTTPLALRERMSFSAAQMPDALRNLHARLGEGSGAAIIDTCNRIEIYACAQRSPDLIQEHIMAFLSEYNALAPSEFRDFIYRYVNADAAQHLFRVAASLESMVVGENEILGQVRQAYEWTRQSGTTNKVLSALFQRALRCGKKVRTATRIGAGKVSVASVAVDLAESILKDLSGKTAMIVGSGQVSEQALKSLLDRGVGQVMVLNRTLSHAASLAGRYRGEAIILQALSCHLHRADIVISSTGAEGILLRAADFERAIEQRERAPMFVIDIAVPRDIERKAAQVPNVYCYDMDDLQRVAERNLSKRQDEIEAAEHIVRTEAAAFTEWRHRLFLEPLLAALTRKYHATREQELQRSLAKLKELTPEQGLEIESLSRRIANALLRDPVAALKKPGSAERREELIQWAQTLFSLEDIEP